jgi:hypothetical protein
MEDATLLEVLKVSGPSGGLVIVLGWLVRGWIGSVGRKLDAFARELTKVRERVARLEGAAE